MTKTTKTSEGDENLYFYDTNVLLSNLEFVKQNGEFLLSPTTIGELENIKTSANKDDEVKFQARRAVRFLAENRSLWEAPIHMENHMYLARETCNLPDINDGNIVADFYVESLTDKHEMPVVFVTGDLLCGLYAEQAVRTIRANNPHKEVPDVLILQNTVEEKIYGGYEEVELNSDEYTVMFDKYQNGENPYELIENQYLIVHCEGKTTEYVYRGGQLKALKLPKGIKALNAKQRCVLDLLENEDVPIKVICGVYGTGKTYLSVNVAVSKVTKSIKSDFSKVFLVRQPYGEGDEIGFLKGTKADKIQDFFNPVLDNIDGGEFTMRVMMENGQLDADVPFYMKGRSLARTIMLVDEAEDLTLKQIKLLGSRVADKSNIVFMGDWKQAAGKYQWNCGLVQFIKYVKENPSPLVGVMVMDEDVRSNASKYFADI